jgi:hypothetical protein
MTVRYFEGKFGVFVKMSLLLIGSLAFSCAHHHDSDEVIIPDNPFNLARPHPTPEPMPIVEPKKKKKKKKKKKISSISSISVLPEIKDTDEFYQAFPANEFQ